MSGFAGNGGEPLEPPRIPGRRRPSPSAKLALAHAYNRLRRRQPVPQGPLAGSPLFDVFATKGLS